MYWNMVIYDLEQHISQAKPWIENDIYMGAVAAVLFHGVQSRFVQNLLVGGYRLAEPHVNHRYFDT